MALLGGTTSLLLLGVFTIVNISVLVLRKDRVVGEHFKAGRILPVVGTFTCVYLVLPWSSGRPAGQYEIAGVLLAIGLVLWGITWYARRQASTNA